MIDLDPIHLIRDILTNSGLVPSICSNPTFQITNQPANFLEQFVNTENTQTFLKHLLTTPETNNINNGFFDFSQSSDAQFESNNYPLIYQNTISRIIKYSDEGNGNTTLSNSLTYFQVGGLTQTNINDLVQIIRINQSTRNTQISKTTKNTHLIMICIDNHIFNTTTKKIEPSDTIQSVTTQQPAVILFSSNSPFTHESVNRLIKFYII